MYHLVTKTGFLLLFLLLGSGQMFAQDFILYVPAPSDEISADWTTTLEQQAPGLSASGFTYIWLPSFSRSSSSEAVEYVQDFYDLGDYGQGPTRLGTAEEVEQLLQTYQANALQLMSSMVYDRRCGGKLEQLSSSVDSSAVRYAFTDFSAMPSGRGTMDASFFNLDDTVADTAANDCHTYDFTNPAVQEALADWTGWLWKTMGIRGIQFAKANKLPPGFVAGLLNKLYFKTVRPPVFVGDYPTADARLLKNWIDSVQYHLPAAVRSVVDVRLLDYPLQQALQRVCDSTQQFDVRTLFTSGMVNAGAINPFSAVTFARPFSDTTLAKPIHRSLLLAYAYLLTNNQVGLPVIHYQDYFDWKPDIDRLLALHKAYIYQASTAYYLNAEEASYFADYASGTPATSLIYQLSGGIGEREIIVAINFAEEPLSVLQQVDSTNWLVGDTLTDVLGRSEFPYRKLGEGHQVRLVVPPRSYAVWVQGQVSEVLDVNGVDFSIAELNGMIELAWEASQEEHIKGYEVQRSINGRRFEPIAWVQSSGTAQATYLHIDHDIYKNEMVYYRIKSVNHDGGYEYSSVEKSYITSTSPQAMEVQSTHSAAYKVVVLHTRQAQQAKIEVFDKNSNPVLTQNSSLKTGENKLRVDLSDLPNGVYYLRVKAGDQPDRLERIVKH